MDGSTNLRLPAAARIGAVEPTVTDLDRALRFYGDALGLRSRAGGPGRLLLSAHDGGEPLLVLHGDPAAQPKPPRTTGLYHAAVLFPSRHELANAVTRLIHHGVPLGGASDHLVSEAIYLDDPDGNGLELYADRPRSAWPMERGELRMETLPLDLNALLATASDWSRPVPPETTVGHLHLQVADLQRAERFYGDVIGFDVMMHYGRSASFLSAGGYHHHLGLNTWAGVGAPPPPPDAVGLRSYTIRLPRSEDVVELSERLAGAAVSYTRVDADGLAGIAVLDPDGTHVRVLAPVSQGPDRSA